jgi:hypothetical protein
MTTAGPPPEIPEGVRNQHPSRRSFVKGFFYGVSTYLVREYLKDTRRAGETPRREDDKGYNAHLIKEIMNDHVNSLLRSVGECKLSNFEALQCSFIIDDLTKRLEDDETRRKTLEKLMKKKLDES